MTVKEIYEKTTFGSLTPAGIEDFNVIYCGEADLYLEMYKKAYRKNAAQKYRDVKALLDREAAVVEYNYYGFKSYAIITRRSFEGPFSKPLTEYQKIILE